MKFAQTGRQKKSWRRKTSSQQVVALLRKLHLCACPLCRQVNSLRLALISMPEGLETASPPFQSSCLEMTAWDSNECRGAPRGIGD